MLRKVYIQHSQNGHASREPGSQVEQAAFDRLEDRWGDSYDPVSGERGMRIWWVEEDELDEFRRLADPYVVSIAY